MDGRTKSHARRALGWNRQWRRAFQMAARNLGIDASFGWHPLATGAEARDMDFLAGGGQVGMLMRAGDWSSSPLGKPEHWPQSLRSVVGLLLNSKFPMFVAWGDELGFLYNDAYAEILGAKHPQALGRRFHDIWAEIWTDIWPMIQAALAGKATFNENLPLVMNRKGHDEQTWFTFSYSPVRDESGKVAGMFCACTETTQAVLAQRRQEFRLKLEDRLRSAASDEVTGIAAEALGQALKVARVGYGEVDDAQQHVIVERDWTDGALASVAGRHRMDDFGPPIIAELKAGHVMYVDDVNTDSRVGESADAFARIGTRSVLAVPLLKGGRFTAMLFLHHPEPRRWTEEEAALAFEVAERTWAAVERSRAESARRKTEARFRGVFESELTGFAIFDANSSEALAVNDHFLSMTGHTRADYQKGRWNWRDITSPEFLEQDEAALAQARERGWWAPYEKEYIRRDGTRFPVRLSSAPLPAEPGRVVVAIHDITEERAAIAAIAASEAEAARREADALYRAYFENSPEALFVVGVQPDGGFIVEEINPTHEASIGLKLNDIRGKCVADILPEDTAQKVLASYRHVVRSGAIYQYREQFDLAGEAQHWDTSLVPMKDHEGRVIRLIGSSRNVTRQVVAEDKLRQSQKMEAMGQLTGGVAHDFNNLLSPIVAALDILQRKGLGGEREQRLVAGAMQSADRAKTLVQRLLAFARRQPLQPIAVDVANLIAGMAELMASTTGPQIKVVVDVASDLPPAKADPNQLEMALLNLAVNARDAMPDGGVLRISVNAEIIGSRHQSGVKPGRYLHLSVADTGTGMDEATIARSVEPFFSTKGIGKGTGLGLSMVHGLASQLGGAMSIQSTVGIGTNVELWLPEGEKLEPPAPDVANEQAIAHRGEVLLVDDEDVIRSSTADMLLELGFRVVEAASAEDALNILNGGYKPSIVISDHLMPGMSGTELARRLRTDRPGIKILIISGYAETAGVPPDLPLLSKPFRSAELAAGLAALN